MLSKSWKLFRRLLREEDGPTTVEYAVQLALIIAVADLVIKTVGTNSVVVFNRVASSIAGS